MSKEQAYYVPHGNNRFISIILSNITGGVKLTRYDCHRIHLGPKLHWEATRLLGKQFLVWHQQMRRYILRSWSAFVLINRYSSHTKK
jgi:hypothetical protein